MCPGRGVLHTPHQTFPQGDGICKRRPIVRLFVPYGAIRRGVFGYPLPCNLKTRRVLYFLPSSNTETWRVLYFLLGSNTETRRVLHFLLSSNTKTQRVLHFLLSSNTETRRVLHFLLSSNTETRRVFMYPGRGVLHTPHQTFPQGDGICKRRPNVRLFVPYGAIRWGVCNTPLPCDLET